MKKIKRQSLFLILTTIIAIILCSTVSAAETNELVNLDSDEQQADSDSLFASISGDGRYVVFDSPSILAPGSSGNGDIFLRDRLTGTTITISVPNVGGTQNGGSYSPSISADGRYVVFGSTSFNLVSGDTNQAPDVFIWDRLSANNPITLISIPNAGGTAQGMSYDPSISADGRYVAFLSGADNLVSGDTNGLVDVFLWDRLTPSNPLILISIPNAGGQADGMSFKPSISSDGQYVTFASFADNLVFGDSANMDVFLWDRLAISNPLTLISIPNAGGIANGNSANPSISGDGRYVVFDSAANNLVSGDNNQNDIFIWDRLALSNSLTLISKPNAGGHANGNSYFPLISSNGRFVIFDSLAYNLVSGDSLLNMDVFIWDRLVTANPISLISLPNEGGEANGSSNSQSISADGRYIVFTSSASNLISLDSNENTDVFLRDRGPEGTSLPPADQSDNNGTPGDQSGSSPTDQMIQVSAASDNVGMQKTGIPLAWLILAILMLFGGLVTTRK